MVCPRPDVPPAVPETETADTLELTNSFEPRDEQDGNEPAASWSWVRWAFLIVSSSAAVFWGVEAVFNRRETVVRDKPEFRRALEIVNPLVFLGNPSPRGVKRYRNRMRYLAMRLRSSEPESSLVEDCLDWIDNAIRGDLSNVVDRENSAHQASVREAPLVLWGHWKFLIAHCLIFPHRGCTKE